MTIDTKPQATIDTNDDNSLILDCSHWQISWVSLKKKTLKLVCLNQNPYIAYGYMSLQSSVTVGSLPSSLSHYVCAYSQSVFPNGWSPTNSNLGTEEPVLSWSSLLLCQPHKLLINNSKTNLAHPPRPLSRTHPANRITQARQIFMH